MWRFLSAWYTKLLIGIICGIALVSLIIPLVMRYAMAPYTYISIDAVPKTEVAIVPGASVYEGKPSPILAARADMAIELYLLGKVSKILVTGDNSSLSHDEVTPVRKYLVAAGIPPQDIFLDHAGFDTYSSMYRAIAIFHASSATVVTQDFHMPRALYLARHLGLTAYGLDADGGKDPFDYFREVPASMKALWDLYTHQKPKYLGKPYPLTGDGIPTWY